MDPMTVAAAAVAFVTPYVIDLGKEAAGEAAADAGKSVWSWIKDHLVSPAGTEAVADVERSPEKPENTLALQAALAKALTTDRGAMEELAKLLKANSASISSQDLNVRGGNNKIAQVTGKGNTTEIK